MSVFPPERADKCAPCTDRLVKGGIVGETHFCTHCGGLLSIFAKTAGRTAAQAPKAPDRDLAHRTEESLRRRMS